MQQLGYKVDRQYDYFAVYVNILSDSNWVILTFRKDLIPIEDFERILIEREGFDATAVAAAIEQWGLS